MKALLRTLAPRGVRRQISRMRRRLGARANAGRTAEEVFSEIYRQGKWAAERGSLQGAGPFQSGSGSATESVVEPYIETIAAELKSLPHKPVIVDLGCGDFTVGRRFLEYCSSYIAIDVVAELIDHLRKTANDWRVQFLALDVASPQQNLPNGDVCFVRQVLQHLSNAQIASVLAKLGKYQFVYITEHYPADSALVFPNRDKVHGADIRLYDNSGVYLDQPPFNLPRAALSLVLEVPAESFGDLYDGGFIRTYLFKPAAAR